MIPMIKEYITEICSFLDITEPIVSYDTSDFPSKTTMAQCSSDGSTIYLKKIAKPNPDYMLAIAHELRHIWQIRTNKEMFLSNYKSINESNSVDEYNLQPAEIDANAFASIILNVYFHLQPQWNNLSQEVVNEINNRINVIIHKLND